MIGGSRIKIMKKYILSPLCSALVVPGLGQIINGNIKKGLIILAIVFLFIIGLTIDLAITINALFSQADLLQHPPEDVLTRFRKGDFSSLSYLIIAFGLVWIYAVFDALWIGIKLERGDEPR